MLYPDMLGSFFVPGKRMSDGSCQKSLAGERKILRKEKEHGYQ